MAANDIGAEINHIVSLFSQGKFDEVIERLAPILDILPGNAALLNLAGAAHAGAGRLRDAISAYDKAIAVDPAFADAHSNRGLALRDQGHFGDALASFDRAIGCRPDFADAHSNRGIVLKELGRLEEALRSYNQAIALKPQYPSAYYNRGNVLFALQWLDEAIWNYDQAIAQDPGHAEAHGNRGNALQELGRLDEATASLSRAIMLRPSFAEAHANQGLVLSRLKRLDAALDSYAEAIRLDPANSEAIGNMLLLKMQMCDWTEMPDEAGIAAIGIETGAVSPFSMLALDDDAGRHLRRSEQWARTKYSARERSFPRIAAPAARIRLGYFSADFHNHATMWLMGLLLELHDKERFEVHAFSYGPDHQDSMRQRVIDAVDGFHDISGQSDSDAADLARDQRIDIAIDLKGYTGESRLGIFACGVAPIQISFLGYPGSIGADFIDYIVADAVVIPESKRQCYAEKLICLPHSYQVNDAGRPIADHIPGRAALGLPRDAFVFCCFNNNYKITAREFDIWMRLLSKVEGSVLWLLRDNDWAMANLRRQAEQRGIDRQRLVFAERMPTSEHLGRHRHADLFLDTFNCNAHTTASDALWAGLPVVTKAGDGFAARVAASLLHAVGLPELVTDNVEAYERLALDLARDPDRLAAIKATLDRNRLGSPLFDTGLFTRTLEHGYELAFARHRQGLPPDHIIVPAPECAGSDDACAAPAPAIAC